MIIQWIALTNFLNKWGLDLKLIAAGAHNKSSAYHGDIKS